MPSKKKKIIIKNDAMKFGEEVGFLANESYKRLRTNVIYSLAATDKCKYVGVTSSVAEEGKSTISANLAYSLAMTGKKVLLLECDLRRPNLAHRLGLDGKVGISDLLVGEKNNLQETIQTYEKDIKFDVIVAGNIPPNPSELLGSSRMNKILELLSTAYDYIIFDLPPVAVVVDPLIIAKMLHGMVVVVKQGFTEKTVLRSTVSQVQNTGVKILGFVYNYSNEFAGKKRNGKYYGYY